jgi:hypothetical protein
MPKMMHFPIRALVSESQRELLFGGKGEVVLSGAGEGFESCEEEVENVRGGREDWNADRRTALGLQNEGESRTFILQVEE